MEKKAFLANPRHQYRASQWEEHDCSAIMNRMEVIMSIQVCLISWMNFNHKQNSGKKAFPTNPKQ